MGLTPLGRGELAAVVTSLEMLARPRPRPLAGAPLRLTAWPKPDLTRYRALFRRVGAPWLWFSRLAMSDETLAGIIHDPAVRVHAVVDPRGIEVGMLELDSRQPPSCEIAFLGLVPELAGQGFGGWLMGHALALAWTREIERVWVHTCTLDHPAALGFYRKHGFQPFARAVEYFPDPRLLGLLPADAAPQIACLP